MILDRKLVLDRAYWVSLLKYRICRICHSVFTQSQLTHPIKGHLDVENCIRKSLVHACIPQNMHWVSSTPQASCWGHSNEEEVFIDCTLLHLQNCHSVKLGALSSSFSPLLPPQLVLHLCENQKNLLSLSRHSPWAESLKSEGRAEFQLPSPPGWVLLISTQTTQWPFAMIQWHMDVRAS